MRPQAALWILLCASLPAQRDALARKLELTPHKEEQAIVTRALTWLTGGARENDYVSVGRLANYFGFVRLRVASGHSLTRGALGQRVFALLDAAQRRRLGDLLDAQWPALERCEAARERINRVLEGLLVGGHANEATVVQLGEAFGVAEAELGVAHAEGFAAVVATLSPSQRDALAALRGEALGGGVASFRLATEDRRDLLRCIGEPSGRRGQEFWNLCARLCSWVTGTPADNDYDTAGKPSQHFGFVELRLASGHGVTRGGVADAIAAICTPAQVTDLRRVAAANAPDFDAFFAARARVARALECGLVGQAIDGVAARQAGAEQGIAEARMTWRQAQAFLGLRQSLTPEQAEALVVLRSRLTPAAARAAGDGAAGDGAANGIPAAAVRAADADAGARWFALCAMCHPPDGRSGVGPGLRGVVDRPVAGVPGFAYSPALAARGANGERWSRSRLDAFLTDPMRDTPGTRMPFAGIADPQERAALLEFLARLGSNGSSPAPSPSQDVLPQERVAAPAGGAATAPPRRAPNFVFVQAEGVGFAGTSVAMQADLPAARVAPAITPNLVRLAAEGLRMPRFYVSAPRCTPSRASFLTGRGTASTGITYVHEGGGERRGGSRNGERAVDDGPHPVVPPTSLTELPAGIATIASVLRGAGYATAHFGKWHVGRAAPAAHGFDQDDGANTNQGPGRDRTPNPEQAAAITQHGIAFMRQQVAERRPFYLQLSHYGGGSAEESRAETRQALAAELRGTRGKDGFQLAILADVDRAIGELLAALDELGVADETYVVFSSDHGAAGRMANRPLRGGKGSVYEGGVRVPMIVRGPGIPAGGEARAFGASIDLLPTFARLAGVTELPAGIEGGSLVDCWQDPAGGAVHRPDESLVLHFPHYDLGSAPASVVYRGGLKLIRWYEDDRVELYDLLADPAEQNDLGPSRPAVVRELERHLDARLDAAGAARPAPNPAWGK